MAHLFEFQDDRIVIMLDQRTVLHDGGFWSHVGLVARIENPTQALVEITGILHGIEVVHLLARHWLVAQANGLGFPRLAIGKPFGGELAVVVYALQNILLVRALVELAKPMLQTHLREYLGGIFAQITLDEILQITVFTIMQKVVNLSFIHVSMQILGAKLHILFYFR